jgi:hypothetical protein
MKSYLPVSLTCINGIQRETIKMVEFNMTVCFLLDYEIVEIRNCARHMFPMRAVLQRCDTLAEHPL